MRPDTRHGPGLALLAALPLLALAVAGCERGDARPMVAPPPVAVALVKAHRVADRILVTRSTRSVRRGPT